MTDELAMRLIMYSLLGIIIGFDVMGLFEFIQLLVKGIKKAVSFIRKKTVKTN